MLDTICTIPLSSDLFTLALHPTQPILTVGLASGHVHTYRLPSLENEGEAEDDDDESDSDASEKKNSNHPNGTHIPNGIKGKHSTKAAELLSPIISKLRRSSSASQNGLGSIELMWETRRHKGSCRCVAYSHDGNVCYSAGTDGVVKAFEPETGKVTSKVVLPRTQDTGKLDKPSVMHVLSPRALLVALDSGVVVMFELKDGGKVLGRIGSEWEPHGIEHVNAIVPIPVGEGSTSGFPKQWVTVGAQTLAVTDVRKGVVATSEEQDTELTSVVMLGGLKKGGTSVGEKVVVGQSDGVLSLWERGVWGDLDERITIDRWGASVDALLEVPQELAQRMGRLKMSEKVIAAGLDDGRVRFVRIGRNSVLDEWDVKHDDYDGVIGLGFDVEGRMVSGGGQVVKVWTDAPGTVAAKGTWKRQFEDEYGAGPDGYDEYQYEDEQYSEESEEEQRDGPRKKRKRNKGKDKSGGRDIDFKF